MRERSVAALEHMLEALGYVKEDLAGVDRARFRADRRVRQLVERNLELISAASRRLEPEILRHAADIDWRAVAGMGNVLRHEYHHVDPDALWETCARDLEPIEAAVRRMIRHARPDASQDSAT